MIELAFVAILLLLFVFYSNNNVEKFAPVVEPYYKIYWVPTNNNDNLAYVLYMKDNVLSVHTRLSEGAINNMQKLFRFTRIDRRFKIHVWYQNAFRCLYLDRLTGNIVVPPEEDIKKPILRSINKCTSIYDRPRYVQLQTRMDDIHNLDTVHIRRMVKPEREYEYLLVEPNTLKVRSVDIFGKGLSIIELDRFGIFRLEGPFGNDFE